jgi:hypothetical protein
MTFVNRKKLKHHLADNSSDHLDFNDQTQTLTIGSSKASLKKAKKSKFRINRTIGHDEDSALKFQKRRLMSNASPET